LNLCYSFGKIKQYCNSGYFGIGQLMTSTPQHKLTLAGKFRQALHSLSPAERKLMRLILSAGQPPPTKTVADLALFADVSAPTVLRALNKLGFEGYGQFRALATEELSTKRISALEQMTATRASQGEGTYRNTFSENITDALRESLGGVDDLEHDQALDLLADGSRKQLLLGGRFSQSVAEQMYNHATLIRPGCELVPLELEQRMNRLIDVGRGHVVTIFDFRRYQSDCVDFAKEAKKRRAKVLLITDPWMSPAADYADVVLVAEVRIASPFDSLTPATGITEFLIAGMYDRMQDKARIRLTQFEEIANQRLFQIDAASANINTEDDK
jgi:DNA-binding MurR/RpiR family transcriptional regulator